ncbi:Yip1 domain-containing protein [Heterostelium album PN500]|uniref:Protein YIPF n=1 Tax=Heterostelium pallidum (strain ATCC 26659 / Pp 5 / PN500) TaxID=670386 RepID=D3BM06_HETP5|nr:Yip1 domain-containing protein [Heterostelium album PN500]EFA77607.1 Yip1 domain-containing protein [Heterostelium album PN500]|eukprot:XP_020429735.1 Yip1 domain-containing protein [Heterostelium album PN500]
MSYNNHDDGNPFYTDVPTTSPTQTNNNNINNNTNNNTNNNVNNQYNNQPQAIFTNTNVNFDDYSSAPKQSTQYQPDLQFQSFEHATIDVNSKSNNNSNNNNNRIGGGGINVPEADFSETVNLNSEGQADQKKYSFYQPQYYRFLFNVDTTEVAHRLLRSMIPIKFSFFDLIRENPDIYGPFWVTTTLVFIIAATANLNSYFHSDHKLWEANFKTVVYSAIAIYGYALVIPLVLWGIFKWMKLGLRILDMLCIYGYALFIFIPASIICLIPVGLVQWIVVGVCTLVSGAFLVTNVFAPLKGDYTKRGLIICGGIAALHLGLALLLKLYFFANNTDGQFVVTPTPSPTPTLTPTTTTTGSSTGNSTTTA